MLCAVIVDVYVDVCGVTVQVDNSLMNKWAEGSVTIGRRYEEQGIGTVGAIT